jgi:predicted kinase
LLVIAHARIVVVTGPPASGKSTLVSGLADDFSLPTITKDGIKEALFDSLGVGDRAWSQRLGLTSYELIFRFLEIELRAARSVAVEANFNSAAANPRFQDLHERYSFSSLQLHCAAPVDVLFDRYETRIQERHVGHADNERLGDMRPLLDPARYLLDLSGTTITIDTTSFDHFDYEPIRLAVEHHLSG